MSKAGLHAGETAVEGISADDLRTFVDDFAGEVVLPDDDAYHEARQVWNGMINKYPAIVARPTGPADVVRAVELARDQGLPLAVRGGGHNVAGSAVCDGGIVVDLADVNDIRVDPDARTARVGGGATIGDVDRETQLFGLAVPLGVVSQTGIAGLTLNGGVGHVRRAHGLACDSLVSADVVTADGEVVVASEDRNPDLLWALRGGGGNFGVVTSFEYRLHDVGPEVYGLLCFYHGDRSIEALERFREWAVDAPDEASVLPIYMFVPELEEYPEEAWGEPAFLFAGCYNGAIEEAESVFEPLREVAEPIVDFSGPMPYAALQRLFDLEFPDGRRYYWKSTYVEELTDDLVELFARRGAEAPSSLSTVDLWHLGGAIAEVDPEETAFWHRNKPYMLNVEANWDDPLEDEANVAWVSETLAEARELPGIAGGYGNFPGLREDPVRAVFGDNLERLADVKATYDPENLFSNNQNVEPSR